MGALNKHSLILGGFTSLIFISAVTTADYVNGHTLEDYVYLFLGVCPLLFYYVARYSLDKSREYNRRNPTKDVPDEVTRYNESTQYDRMRDLGRRIDKIRYAEEVLSGNQIKARRQLSREEQVKKFMADEPKKIVPPKREEDPSTLRPGRTKDYNEGKVYNK